MNVLRVVNEDFLKWNTSKKFDVIIMNPPFVKLGSKFIIRAMDMLFDGGYLGCVMLPTWRSITTTIGNKPYYKMLEQGGFHMVHMYNQHDTKTLFGRSIGQVDTFVWQKGVRIFDTKIINQRGMEYTANLYNYPQAPPVLPPEIYDVWFDQGPSVQI